MQDNKILKQVKADYDDDYDYDKSGVKLYNETDIINDVDAYIDEPIRSPQHYRNLFQYMRRMKEYDKLKIWLHSPGGYLESALEIINTMQQAKGEVIVITSGYCASAATMIALSAPQLLVQDNTIMMFHFGSGGISGKFNEMIKNVTFNHERMKRAMWESYEGFLTQQEFDNMLSGVDYYFDNEEINRRLELRAVYQTKQLENQK